jgi:hypothetical protein
MYRCFGIILGFFTTSIGSYICLYQYKKFKEINQMLEKINKKVDKRITFDENTKIITPFNFETGEVDPNFIYEEDSKNIITQKVLKLIEENNHSFTDKDLTKIINLINQYKGSEESRESRESRAKEAAETLLLLPEDSEEFKDSEESKESEESEESYDKISTPPVREK